MTRWYREKKKEHFYKKAKRKGYRSRSVFKLKQIQKKFNIISKADCVLDLGAAPGGWSQVSKEYVGSNGEVIGVDLNYIKPLDGVKFLRGDLTEEKIIEEIKDDIDKEYVDVILSDMSPNISGNYSVDHARSVYLCYKALEIAKRILKNEGNFVCKVFEGEDLKKLEQKLSTNFKKVERYSPPASRKSSSEIYLVGIRRL
ncbi:MAG: RlmE family RNA methyltransferase [Candidatus Thermoplasmatota archaeon]